MYSSHLKLLNKDFYFLQEKKSLYSNKLLASPLPIKQPFKITGFFT